MFYVEASPTFLSLNFHKVRNKKHVIKVQVQSPSTSPAGLLTALSAEALITLDARRTRCTSALFKHN